MSNYEQYTQALKQIKTMIKNDIEQIVNNQTMSLETKNSLMLPLIKKNTIINEAINKFEFIDKTKFDGRCSEY
ncbi:MAG: hypothetical protein DRG11_03535 [Epsilonproteobacteria bacterium]|nr:MAG: hypothetical protein DRG11_03535 [Campylobacterota bacterium]